MTTNRRESRSLESYQRSNTDNLAESTNAPKKKRQGKSEFIKSKFDIDYDPKYRGFKSSGFHFQLKKKPDTTKADGLADVVMHTQEEVKKGKKLVIDWSQQNNFRITRFPDINSHFSLSRRANTEEVYISKLDTPVKAKYYEYLEKYKSNSSFKEIADRGEHLRSLISDSIFQNRLKKRKIKIKCKSFQLPTQPNELERSSLYESNCSQERGDPHFNYTIIEEVEEKQKQFFEKNNEKIMKAIEYEQNLQLPIHEKVQKSKFKIEEIQERIICKSKLTLLKNDLIKKFKEIKEGMLDETAHAQQLKAILQ